MAFVPELGMVVWVPRREETTALVQGVNLEAGEMWLKPFLGGGKNYTATISDRWAEVRKARLVEAWFLAGPVGSGAASWSRAYFTRAGALNAKADDSIALVHVNSDGTVDPLEYFI